MNKPYLIFAWLDGHVRWGGYPVADCEWFLKRLKEAGVHAVRLLPTWKDDRCSSMIQPFLESPVYENTYDLDLPNSMYDKWLQMFCDAMHRAGILVAMDALDNCAAGKEWDAWRRNVNRVRGIYDIENGDLARRLLAFVDRVRSCGVDLIGLGNELRFPQLAPDVEDRDGLRRWTAQVIVPLAVKALEKQSFVWFSADDTEGGTTNKIRSALMKCEGGWLDPHQIIEVLHGIGVPRNLEDLKAKDVWSGAVHYGISDDGVGCNEYLAPEDRGLCEEPNLRCKASVANRLACVRAAGKTWGDRFAMVEFLAPEIAMCWNSPRKLDASYSVEPFRRVREIFGMPLPPLIPETRAVTVCSRSKLLPSLDCDPFGLIRMEFPLGDEPREACSTCEPKPVKVRICTVTGRLATRECIVAGKWRMAELPQNEVREMRWCEKVHSCWFRYMEERPVWKWQLGAYLLCKLKKFFG